MESPSCLLGLGVGPFRVQGKGRYRDWARRVETPRSLEDPPSPRRRIAALRFGTKTQTEHDFKSYGDCECVWFTCSSRGVVGAPATTRTFTLQDFRNLRTEDLKSLALRRI